MAKPPKYFRYKFWSLSMYVTIIVCMYVIIIHINHKLEIANSFWKRYPFKNIFTYRLIHNISCIILIENSGLKGG